jgi:16S rRNA (guanine527-N7)-methyltransferase
MSATPSSTEGSASWRIKEWFPQLSEKTHSQLKLYFNELLKFNKVVNLISSKTINNADSVHFADSILASLLVNKKVNKNKELYDIGSGNGFPGLVYSILFPEQKMVLVDSDERKCEFLKHMAIQLGNGNIEVQTKKIESFAPDSIEQAICRGFAPMPRILLTLRKIVKQGGQVFHMKAEEWGMEVAEIPIQLCSAWQPLLEGEYILPEGNVKLFVIRSERLGNP